MDPFRQIPDESEGAAAEPQPQTQSAGDSGGRMRNTRVGSSDDGSWYTPRDFHSNFGTDPVRNANWKDLAIDALAQSRHKTFVDVYDRLLSMTESKMDRTDGAEELADHLATLVVTAYTVAQYVPRKHVMHELQFTFSCLSKWQLQRIVDMAAK